MTAASIQRREIVLLHDYDEQSKIMTIRLSGKLNAENAAYFCGTAEDLIDGYPQAQEVGFDLSKLSFIDEEGLQHLLSLVQRTDGGWSVRFSICGVNPRIEGMFTLDCLIQAFENADIEVRETAA
jgi:anti-anti-sigma factor